MGVPAFAGPVFPRLKATRFLAEARRQLGIPDGDRFPGIEDRQLPIGIPLAGDLVLTFATDEGSAFVSLTQAMLMERGLDFGVVQQQAMDNLAREGGPAIEVKRLGPAFQVSMPNDLTACIYFFDDFWQDIEGQLGAAPVAAFAHRNLVAFTARDNREGIDFLREAVRRLSPDDTHALSRRLYVWEGKWEQLPEPGEKPAVEVVASPVGDRFPDADPSGRARVPLRLSCACGAAEKVPRERVEQASRGAALTALVPDEARAFRAATRAARPDDAYAFELDFRCAACRAPYVVQGAEYKSSLLGATLRILNAWERA